MSIIRKMRGVNQKIYLIDILPITSDNMREFAVMGSTGNLYNVTIKDIPECTCPDYQTRHARCKHIYFILIRIMKVSEKCEDKENFTTANLRNMFAKQLMVQNDLMANQNIKIKYEKLKNGINNIIEKKDTNDLCPMCLDDLDNGEELDYCKHSCGKQIHDACYKMWIKVKPANCLYCTKPWFETSNKYVNLK